MKKQFYSLFLAFLLLAGCQNSSQIANDTSENNETTASVNNNITTSQNSPTISSTKIGDILTLDSDREYVFG